MIYSLAQYQMSAFIQLLGFYLLFCLKKQKINSIHLEAAAGANAPVRTAFMPDLPSLLNGSQNTNTASYT